MGGFVVVCEEGGLLVVVVRVDPGGGRVFLSHALWLGARFKKSSLDRASTAWQVTAYVLYVAFFYLILLIDILAVTGDNWSVRRGLVLWNAVVS